MNQDIETVTGDVVAPEAPSPAASLTPQQLQAAMADAYGAEREEIANLIGVSISTITKWRRKSDYSAYVAQLRDEQRQGLARVVLEMRHELVDGVRAAIRTLVMALDAETDKGKPSWQTRMRAAETLMEHGIALHKEQLAAENQAGLQAPTQAIQIVIGDRPPEPPA